MKSKNKKSLYCHGCANNIYLITKREGIGIISDECGERCRLDYSTDITLYNEKNICKNFIKKETNNMNMISCYNQLGELEHFKVPEAVYLYIQQLEHYIKYPDYSNLKEMYKDRFK
jgi:hypothetical protein